MEVLFATGNKGKVTEAAKILGEAGVTVKHYPFQHREIRSDSLEEIARDAVRAAYKRCKEPVFVEDAGLFIPALKGFPGTYSSWVLEKLGNEGVLRLMEGVHDRSAYFEACIAYQEDNYTIAVFHGKCPGRITEDPRGSKGFGFDPIFIPDGENQTFAESITLKNKLSHRYKTLLEFSKSLKLRR